jgi:hypothetical protein
MGESPFDAVWNDIQIQLTRDTIIQTFTKHRPSSSDFTVISVRQDGIDVQGRNGKKVLTVTRKQFADAFDGWPRFRDHGERVGHEHHYRLTYVYGILRWLEDRASRPNG